MSQSVISVLREERMTLSLQINHPNVFFWFFFVCLDTISFSVMMYPYALEEPICSLCHSFSFLLHVPWT